MKNTTNRYKLILCTIYTVLAACFIGLPSSMIAFGSDITSQQSPLYPYQSMLMLQDDFATGVNTNGTTGVLGWVVNGGVTTAVNAVSGRPGLILKNTSAVINTFAQMTLDGAAQVFEPANAHSIIWIVQLNTNDANTTVRLGAGNPFTGAPVDGIYFEKLDADTNWFCVTRAGGVQTRNDSGVAVNTNFNSFKYVRNSTGVTFQINKANVCNQSTNIPTTQLNPGNHIVNSAAASKTMNIDYFEFVLTGLQR